MCMRLDMTPGVASAGSDVYYELRAKDPALDRAWFSPLVSWPRKKLQPARVSYDEAANRVWL